MKRHTGPLVVAMVALAIGIAFGPTFATAADTLKDVIVRNDDSNPVPTKAIGTTQVAGSVAVNNLPTAEDGSIRTTAPAVRRGHFLFAPPYHSAIPTGVVVTDVLINWQGGTSPCLVTLDSADFPILRFNISSAQRTAELHLETGLQSEWGNQLEWQVRTTGCVGYLLWTGYEG